MKTTDLRPLHGGLFLWDVRTNGQRREETIVWLEFPYGLCYNFSNIFRESELDKESNLHFLQIANADRPVAFYSLDVIISVGYRVKSRRGIAFRKWAASVLKQYIIKGYAVNENRLRQLGDVIRLMKRTQDALDITRGACPRGL